MRVTIKCSKSKKEITQELRVTKERDFFAALTAIFGPFKYCPLCGKKVEVIGFDSRRGIINLHR
jgi:hypothetical protein